jgi:hypothetical protein
MATIKNKWGGSTGQWGRGAVWGVTPTPYAPPEPPVPPRICWQTRKSQLLFSTMPPRYQKSLNTDTLLRQLLCAIGTMDNQIGGDY